MVYHFLWLVSLYNKAFQEAVSVMFYYHYMYISLVYVTGEVQVNCFVISRSKVDLIKIIPDT